MPEWEGEAKTSAGEDVETSNRVGGADQSVGYFAHFAKMVKLYQKKNQNCFGYSSPDHPMTDCLKDLSKTSQKVCLNGKEGVAKKEGQAPQKPEATQQVSPDEAPCAWGCLRKFPS